MSFCEVVKNLRDEKGVTQREVARACGFTPTCICQLESGVRNPTGSTIKALADYFQVSADYLLERTDDFGSIIPKHSPTASALSDEERQLLEIFSRMDRAQKIKALGYCEGLISVKTGARYPNFQA